MSINLKEVDKQLKIHDKYLNGKSTKRGHFKDIDFSGQNIREILKDNSQGMRFENCNFDNSLIKLEVFEDCKVIGCDFRLSVFHNPVTYPSYFRNALLKGNLFNYEIQEGLLSQIAKKVIFDKNTLDMMYWHNQCGTAHCIGGWACFLSKRGQELEKIYGTEIAGLLILGEEVFNHFYDSHDKAYLYLESIYNQDKVQ